jgi:hypothetical protein
MARIGDRERERAAALLRRHFVQGRLSVDELGERLGAALSARRDSDVSVALADLPAPWRERSVLETAWRRFRRAVFVVAVWALWWAASLVLLVGFVASVVASGLSLANGILFPALWLAATLLAVHVSRRARRAG